jgi:hypothetical protein
MHPTVAKLRKEKRISLATWAKRNGFHQAYCSMVINGKRGVMDFGKSLEIVTALKSIGVWVETKEEKESGGGK